MKKRTVRAFYGKAQGRLESFIAKAEALPLAYGETTEARKAALDELKEKAAGMTVNRVEAHKGRDRRAPHRGKGGIPIVHSGKRQRAKDRKAAAAAIKRAHDPSLREPTGKQKRAAAKFGRRVSARA